MKVRYDYDTHHIRYMAKGLAKLEPSAQSSFGFVLRNRTYEESVGQWALKILLSTYLNHSKPDPGTSSETSDENIRVARAQLLAERLQAVHREVSLPG